MSTRDAGQGPIISDRTNRLRPCVGSDYLYLKANFRTVDYRSIVSQIAVSTWPLLEKEETPKLELIQRRLAGTYPKS